LWPIYWLSLKADGKMFAIKGVVFWYFEHFRHEYFCCKVPLWTSTHPAHCLETVSQWAQSKSHFLPSQGVGYPDNLHNSRTFTRDTSVFKGLCDRI
jgi:hypothetical protein